MSVLRASALALGVCLALAASAATATASMAKIDTRAQFLDALSGKSLRIGIYGLSLDVQPGGKIVGRAVGRPVTGDWAWQDGYFCRTIFWGEREIPYNCQRVDYDGDTMRFTSDRGAGRSADFNLR
ncbi:dihydrodipicolinate reductase [Pseudaestuariivita sp.]|uniref:dihydrodipicolinate reductase n=1 Tax=Pseudaestuariivita sp. TaxID=2211669 RepID=UPI0040585B22